MCVLLDLGRAPSTAADDVQRFCAFRFHAAALKQSAQFAALLYGNTHYMTSTTSYCFAVWHLLFFLKAAFLCVTVAFPTVVGAVHRAELSLAAVMTHVLDWNTAFLIELSRLHSVQFKFFHIGPNIRVRKS